MEPGERLRLAREIAGLSRRQVAERSSYSVSGIGALENGQNGLRREAAEELAPIVKASVEWLLLERGDPPTQRPAGNTVRRPTPGKVPYVGLVGANTSLASYYASADDPNDEVDAPDNATPSTVAAGVRGDSLGPLLDTWLVFYDDVRSPVTPDLFNKLCVVALADDRVLVKEIRPAANGRFHLISNSSEPPILDEEVMWAARVTDMRPR